MKRRLIRESISVEQMEKYISMYNSMSEEEKMSWWKAIRQCVKELKEEGLIISDIAVGTFSMLLIIIAVKYNQPELLVAPAIVSGVSAGFDAPRWKKIIACARAKREGEQNKSIEPMKEMKIIKLTESDLNRIVRRIIKEDEMMAGPSKDTFCSIDLKKVGKNSTVSSIQGGKAMRTNGKELKKGDLLNSKTIETIKLSQNATVIADGKDEPTIRTYAAPRYTITCRGVEVEYGD
jgi:hypothetical protein